jgi:hypothetical protein
MFVFVVLLCFTARAGVMVSTHALYLGCAGDGTRDSSVSIVSGYGLDYRAIQVRSPAEANDFSSSLCVQTGFGAQAASSAMGTGGPFAGSRL